MVQGMHAVYLISSCRLPPAGGHVLACVVSTHSLHQQGRGCGARWEPGNHPRSSSSSSSSNTVPMVPPLGACDLVTPAIATCCWSPRPTCWPTHGCGQGGRCGTGEGGAPLHTGCYTGQARVCVMGRGRVVDTGPASPHSACLEGHAYLLLRLAVREGAPGLRLQMSSVAISPDVSWLQSSRTGPTVSTKQACVCVLSGGMLHDVAGSCSKGLTSASHPG